MALVPSSGPTIRDPFAEVVATLLAGGQSRRLGGGDKCLLPIGGRPMLAHVVERLGPQVRRLSLNANGDSSRFAGFALPVVPDPPGRLVGPLGGILAGMRWAIRLAPAAQWIVTVPTDTPFLPRDLVGRLSAAIESPFTVAVARSRGRVHPVIAVWPVSLADDLASWLETETHRKVRAWLARNSPVAVDFDEPGGSLDPFFNVNTAADVALAAQLAEAIA